MKSLPALLLVVVGMARGAAAQSPTATGLVVEEQEEGGSRWGGLVISDTTVGFGTFVSGAHSDDPFVAETLSIRPSFRIDELPGGAVFFLRQDLQFEFTDPNNATGRRFDHADTMLWLIAPRLWTEPNSGVQIGAEARAFLPISYASRQNDKITATTLGLRLERPIGAFVPQLRLLATKNFYANAAPVFDQEDFVRGSEVSRHCREGAEAACGGGAHLVNWSLSAYGAVSYLIDEAWSTTLVMQYAGGWRYASPDDEFTSPFARAGAARAQDTVTTALDLSFQLDDTLGFSAGVNTTQPVFSADNRFLRFPLLDVETPSNNYSGFYFDVIASF